jgi:hypothetical protein
MEIAPKRAMLALVLVLLAAACRGPRTPDAVVEASDGGAAALTCDERARAQELCRSAMTRRCETQGNDCEASCDVRGDLPANGQKGPSSRNEMESTQCRANCRVVREACVGSIVPQCPRLCEGSGAVQDDR